MKIIRTLFSLLILYSLNSNSKDYESYINEVNEKSFSIRIAEKAIEAEKKRLDSKVYYFLPKLNVVNTYKEELKETSDIETNELKVTMTSKLYSSDTTEKVNEFEFKLKNAEIALLMEKERLSSDVTKSLINIHFYNELRQFALSLNTEVKELSNKLEQQYKLGTASSNDLNRASLLISKINNEINLIDKQIKLSISNIEAVTGIPYPENGIKVNDNVINRVKEFYQGDLDLTGNLGYRSLMYQRDIAKNVAIQQDPLYSIDFSAEHNFIDEGKSREESTFMLSANLYLFDYSKFSEKRAQLDGVESAQLKMELRLYELNNNKNTFQLYENSFVEEMSNLDFQISKTKTLIDGQKDEYAVGKVGLYEMLNTRFDLFSTTKQKIDVEIKYLQNKIDMMINSGNWL
ncbi:TolC family protein [Vibrio parahaemolyticus]|uniref:TolC family protein n=4 Tax=Vibrio parahaemolyticus TaxID=670 RepID=UPI0027E3FB59|nr:TolC family protein [Vibrio parahaemolyticus]EHZ2593629.1 TolC family protein [Vibrio parahaemolyticus]EJM7149696.1 TolC family protein [Vibrio parahaemolyticus]WMN68757.1 TolC family protein [Vibrio parahaemolyticus]